MSRKESRPTSNDTVSEEVGLTDPDDATVLVVDDEPRLLGLYVAMLEDRFTVETAESGAEALEALSDDIDVVLLDRRMPAMSGDEVLDQIREAEYDCHIGIVTAVEPDLDILDMEFDSYLVKPVLQRDLRALVDGLLARQRYSDALNELLSLSSRLVSLRQKYSADELAANETYQELQERKADLEATAQAELETLADLDELAVIYRDVVGETIGGEDGE